MKYRNPFAMITLLTVIISILISGSLYGEDAFIRYPIQFVSVPETQTVPVIDGQLDDPCWRDAAVVSDFILTAGKNVKKPATQQTRAFLAYDQTHLYIAFQCFEADIAGMKTTSIMTDDTDMYYDDRVEVFLDVNHDHRSYFELATNSNGVYFDQACYNRLDGSKTCDMDVSKNAFWRVRTQVKEDQWIAEIVIDVTSLGVEILEKGTTFGLNLARVRHPDVVKGDEFFKRDAQGDAEYSAWTYIKDSIRETISNFHQPLHFGDMVLGDHGFKIHEIDIRSTTYFYGPNGYPSHYGKNPVIIKTETPNNKTREAVLQLRIEPPTVASWESKEKVIFSTNQSIQSTYFVTEDLENKIIIQLMDPKTGDQLYRTSYIDMAAPFIEFDLEPLYTRKPKQLNPVSFKLLTDDEVLSTHKLVVTFVDQKTDKVFADDEVNDLTSAGGVFSPIFNVKDLRALPGGNYVIDSRLVHKKTGETSARFKQNLTKFDLELPEAFEVTEGDYNYSGITDYGITVKYPSGSKYVFWASASYIPFWDMDQAILTNEFVEAWGGGNQGCCEPMQDRENRYSSIRILENSPARAVIHWRYALNDPHYKIYFNEWVDEYYTIYPDEALIRQVNLWPNTNTVHEMFEVLVAKPAGTRTEQLYDEAFVTLSTLDGKGHSNKYFAQNKGKYQEFLKQSNDFIIETHFKDRPHPFTVFSLTDELMPGVTRKRINAVSKIVGDTDRRGHWPASRYQIDGYNIAGYDMPNHGNIGNIQADIDPRNQPTTWTFLVGADAKDGQKKYLQAKSWLYPGEMQSKTKGVESKGYLFSERAYAIQVNKETNNIKLTLKGNQSVILNPIFLIKNLVKDIKSVELDNQPVESSRWVTGKTRNDEIVLFVTSEMDQGQTITIRLN